MAKLIDQIWKRMGIYLDGVNFAGKCMMPKSDINFVISEVHRLTNMEE